MPEFRAADPDLQETLELSADKHVLDSARTILEQHDEEIALVHVAVRHTGERTMGEKVQYGWLIELEQEEARLIAEAEANTREKLQGVVDWYNWEFHRFETA